jgi:lambda repressor-like predicted transcriptional regulator
MIAVEDWAEIRRLHRAEGVPIREVARRLGISRNTVRAALASERPPQYERKPRGSVADAYEPQIRVLLAEWPKMPAPVIAALNEQLGEMTPKLILAERQAEARHAAGAPVMREVAAELRRDVDHAQFLIAQLRRRFSDLNSDHTVLAASARPDAAAMAIRHRQC